MAERKSGPRLEKLIDLAQQPGVTAEEAYRIADTPESAVTAENSVKLVEGILLTHPETFRSCERTLRGSERDKEGRDIEVRLRREKSLPGFREFSIEVKSSPRGVYEFRHNLVDGTVIRVRKDRVVELGLEAAIEEYLNEKRIIDLDASRPDLEAELTRRFGLLRLYWKKRVRRRWSK